MSISISTAKPTASAKPAPKPAPRAARAQATEALESRPSDKPAARKRTNPAVWLVFVALAVLAYWLLVLRK